MSYELNQLRAEINELQAAIASERRERVFDQAERQLATLVRNPRQFLSLLKTSGRLVDTGPNLLVETSSGRRSLADATTELLGTDDYHHYSLLPRPPAGSEQPAPDTLRHFTQDGQLKSSDNELLKALSDGQQSQLLLEEVAQILGQRQSTGDLTSRTISQAAPQPQSDPLQQQRSSHPLEQLDDRELLKMLADPQRAAALIEQSLT